MAFSSAVHLHHDLYLGSHGGATNIKMPMMIEEQKVVKSSEELTQIYRRSLQNMREWMGSSPLRFDEKLGIIDAWQEELRIFYRENGHCYACGEQLDGCLCSEPLEGWVQ